MADRTLREASSLLAPGFVAVVAGLLIRRRRTGVEALVAGVAAASAARVTRDAIGRPRPGQRAEGGFPSRHAAAAVAIASAAGRHYRGLGTVLTLAAAAGLLGRVVDEHHDPADIVAGAALGWSLDRVLGTASRVVSR